MAAPTAPDLTSITTEALKRAGYSNPSSAELTRAQTYHIREVKNELYTRLKNLKSLQVVSYTPTIIGQNKYANPTDYGTEMTITLLYGTHTGTLQAGSASAFTLSATEAISSDEAIGRQILITSGTGAGSCSQITSYNATTKVGGVTPDFTTAPAISSGYMVVDTYYPLIQSPSWDADNLSRLTDKDRPTHYFPTGNSTDGEILLYPNPDKVYGMQMRYYTDIMNIDLASTLMTTIYQKYENVWIQGCLVRALQGKDDRRYTLEYQKYEKMLAELEMAEQYGMELGNLQMRISESF